MHPNDNLIYIFYLVPLQVQNTFQYILSKLCMDDQDRQMVLAHELLLLMHSRCCRKGGGGCGSHHAGAQSLDSLPACFWDILECAAHATKDTVALECLVWAMYDNQLGLGKSPILSGKESYGQILWCLIDKAFQGLHMCCPVHTPAMFKPVKEKVKSVVTVLQKPHWPERYSMMRDVKRNLW